LDTTLYPNIPPDGIFFAVTSKNVKENKFETTKDVNKDKMELQKNNGKIHGCYKR